jgi:hypothetical protein
VLYQPTPRTDFGRRSGTYLGEPIEDAGEGTAVDRAVVGTPFQNLEDIMSGERGMMTGSVAPQPATSVGTVAESELPEGIEKGSDESRDDWVARLTDSGIPLEKSNIEALKRVRPTLKWNELGRILGTSKSTIQRVLKGERPEGEVRRGRRRR